MSDDRTWKRLRAVLEALAAEIGGRGWSVEADDAIGSLGLGGADAFRRLALVQENRPPVGDRAVVRRGVVVWRTVETHRRAWYGGGETTSIRWHWEIDDGNGWIRTGTAASLPKAAEALWPNLWRATVRPAPLVVQLLRAAKLEQMGAVRLGAAGSSVRWGYTEQDQRTPAAWLDRHLYPIELHIDGHTTAEGCPYIEHRKQARHLRACLPPALVAAELARLAIRYARDGLEDAEPVFRAAEKAPHIRAPSLPQAVAGAATSIGSVVTDWPDRLRRALAGETAGRFKGRERRMAARADVALRMPVEGREDAHGQPLNHWGSAEGPARLAVPLELLGALWALGLSLREISDVTTGRQTSRSTIGERIKEMRAAPGGSRATGADLVGRKGLAWAREIAGGGSIGGSDLASKAARRHRKNERPGPAAGDAPRTRVRVTRRSGPTLLEQLDTEETADPLREKYRAFLNSLSPLSRKFLEAVEHDGTLSATDAMTALDLADRRALRSVPSQIGRWAPIRGLVVPYEAIMVDGERCWRWIGWRSRDAA